MSSLRSNHSGTLSPEMALLGLLFGGPGHGYDLHRIVISDLGQVWHLSQSQAYAILKRLEARGDVSVEEIPQERLPARQLLHITPEGRRRFLEWLDAPSSGSTRIIRLEFITRLYFLSRYMPERLSPAFARQKAEARKHIERLESSLAQAPESQVYARMSLDMRLRQLRTSLEWLDDSQKLFQRD
jgi:DNA-binding PadR family transcriptional regulator